MKPYTVLLLYPDYLADQYGLDTYLAHVDAENHAKAIRKAQVQALRAQGAYAVASADDFYPLFCTEGHHNDLCFGGEPI